jgi:cell wall-associated NlpC family hydrolase
MMKALVFALLLLAARPAFADTVPAAPVDDFFTKLKTVVTKHLGRPYVWGATGTKSFDCSGFVWRVMFENGILMKRTTARKFYMVLPKAKEEDRAKFGTVIFFDNLKHVGIVDTESTFYHAQVSKGTNLSPLNSFWKRRVYGYRAMPLPNGT